MNPNSISHRLFAAALTQGGQPPVKRPETRSVARTIAKASDAKPSSLATASAARRLSEWSWSGWQHTTI